MQLVACTSYVNHFNVLPAHSEVEKLQKLPSILFCFGCKKEYIISNSSKMVLLRNSFEDLLYNGVKTSRTYGNTVFHGGLQK